MRIQPLIQPIAFDVAQWEADAAFGVFPQGARAKDAVISPASPSTPALSPKKRYLFKRSKRSYPDQFWGEVIAYRIGCLMGLSVPPAFAAFNSNTGFSAALIEWFYLDGEELFAHGGDFMQRLRVGFDRRKGTQHNLYDIGILMRLLTSRRILANDWRQWWVEALLFDALIGNSDRHQDNWGLIFSSNKRQPSDLPACRLAPLFDNGTSLGHERFPNLVAAWSDNRLDQYIAKGTHHVKFALDSHAVVNGHLALLRTALVHWRQYIDLPLLRARLDFSSDELIASFSDLMQLPMPALLSYERIHWINRLLIRRHTLLKDFLNESA